MLSNKIGLVRVYDDGRKLVGKWTGDVCKGYLQHSQLSEELFCVGEFRVFEKEQRVEQIGLGKITYKDGKSYMGEINNSKPCGHGILNVSLDMVYEGQFLDGLYHGYGQIFDVKRGVIKQGEFAYGKLEGCGVFRKSDLRVPGLWKDDKLVLICSDDHNMTLNDWRVKQVISPVKFNEIEYIPTKHGNCEVIFYKLYDGSPAKRMEMCKIIVEVILKAVMCPKHTKEIMHTIAFRIAFETVMEYLNCHVGEVAKFESQPVIDKSLSYLRKLQIKLARERLLAGADEQLDEQEEKALEKEAFRTVDITFKNSQKLILATVQSTLESLPKEFNQETEQVISQKIYKAVAEGIFDERIESQQQEMIDKLIGELAYETFKKLGTDLDRKFKSDHKPNRNQALISRKPIAKEERFLAAARSLKSDGRSSQVHSQVEEEISRLPQLKFSKLNKLATLKSGEEHTSEFTEFQSSCFGAETLGSWERVFECILSTLDKIDASIPDIFQGQLYDDEVSGYGVILKAGQEVYRGEFKDNKAIGVGQLRLDDDCYYLGMVDRLAPQSYGMMVHKNHSQKGVFSNGKKSGLMIKSQMVSGKKGQRTRGTGGTSVGQERLVGLTQYSDSGEKDGLCIALLPEGEALSVYEEGALREYRVLPRGSLTAFKAFSNN